EDAHPRHPFWPGEILRGSGAGGDCRRGSPAGDPRGHREAAGRRPQVWHGDPGSRLTAEAVKEIPSRRRPATMRERTDDHDAVILAQFTKQAPPSAAMPAHSDADIVRLIREAARIGPASRVLDVACGPGLVALALAETARHVTGLDVTPAM